MEPIRLNDLSLGLNSDARASRIHPGACQEGSKNIWLDNDVLAKPPGYQRVTNTLVDEHAILLDGYEQGFVGRCTSTGSNIALGGTNWSMKAVFRCDAQPKDVIVSGSSFFWGTIVYRGLGDSSLSSLTFTNTCYSLVVSNSSTSQDPVLVFVGSDGAAIGSKRSTLGTIEYGTWYETVITYDAAAVGSEFVWYLREVGGSWSSETFALGGPFNPQDIAAPLFIGCSPINNFSKPGERFQYTLPGVVQEVQFWNKTLSSTEVQTTYSGTQLTAAQIAAATNLKAYYKLTSSGFTQTYYYTPDAGTAGPGSSQSPVLEIAPRDTSWRTSTSPFGAPTSGSVSMDFSGIYGGLDIRDSWQYRNQQVRDDGALPFHDYFSFSWKGVLRKLTDRATLMHYVPAGDPRLLKSFIGHPLTVDGGGDITNQTIPWLPIKVKSVEITFTTGGGAVTVVLSDVGDGTLVKDSGAGTLTSGTIDYETGLVNVNYSVAIDAGSASVSYTWLPDQKIDYTFDDWTVGSHANTTFGVANQRQGNLMLAVWDKGGGTGFQFRGVVWHEKDVEDEALALDGASDIVDTLAYPGVLPGTMSITFTTGGGGNTVVCEDNGAGGFVKTSGTGTLAAYGANNTINYTTGVMKLSHSAAIDANSAFVSYQALSATSVETAVGGGGLVAGTLYTVTVHVNNVDEYIRIHVNDEAAVTTDWTATFPESTIPSVPDIPDLEGRRYWMTLGRGIQSCRSINGLPGGSNDVEVEFSGFYPYAGHNGEVNQIIIAGSSEQFDPLSVHSLNQNEVVTRLRLSTFGNWIQSCWNFQEGAGPIVEDIGPMANTINFQNDPKHVWAKSGITTINKEGCAGVFQHQYRTATGTASFLAAIYGGTIYSVNPTSGALTFVSDGLRNDDGYTPSTQPALDSTIICLGGEVGPFQLWKDQLYKLSIDPPSGPLAIGVVDQGIKTSSLASGQYQYVFTYWSEHTQKRSPPSQICYLEIFCSRANVAIGTDAELNQRIPTFGLSLKKGPFDISAAGSHIIEYSGWVGREEELVEGDPEYYETNPGASENPAPLLSINMATNPFIIGDAATPKELATAFDYDETKRVLVERGPGGTVEFKGAFYGQDGYLWLQDSTSANATVRDSAGASIRMDGVASAGTLISGHGVKNHGIKLFRSFDRQVTHVEIWRTIAGGGEFFRVAKIPNATESHTDTTRNRDLSGTTLNLNAGVVNPARFCVDFGGRMVFANQKYAAHILQYTELGEAHNAPPGNTISFTEGSSPDIKGIARTEGVLTLFKQDTTLALTETGSPLIPFQRDVRMRDLGCVSHFGIVNVGETFFYPSEQGFVSYDSTIPRIVSEIIQGTYFAIPAAQHETIAGVHDRRNRCVLWFYGDGTQGTVNNKAFAWFYQKTTPDGRTAGFAPLEGLYVKSAAICEDSNGINRVYLVDYSGFIYEWGTSNTYGVGSLTATDLTISSVTSTTQIVVPQATLANLPNGYTGLPITVVKADGTRYHRYVTADTLASPSTITLNAAVPGMAANDTAIVGSIDMDWISGEMAPAGQESEVLWSKTHLQMTAQSGTPATVSILGKGEHGIPSAAAVELSRSFTNDLADDWIALSSGIRGRRVRLRFNAFGANKPFEVRSVVMHVSGGGRAQWGAT